MAPASRSAWLSPSRCRCPWPCCCPRSTVTASSPASRSPSSSSIPSLRWRCVGARSSPSPPPRWTATSSSPTGARPTSRCPAWPEAAARSYQLNPHFLFNTLNSLSALVLRGRPDCAERMIESLSAFLRTTLIGDPCRNTTPAEEIRVQRLYLDIEQVRFPDRLRVKIDIPPEIEAARSDRSKAACRDHRVLGAARTRGDPGGGFHVDLTRPGRTVCDYLSMRGRSCCTRPSPELERRLVPAQASRPEWLIQQGFLIYGRPIRENSRQEFASPGADAVAG